MSHNINTYNTNAFDVNSNQSVTIGTTQEYMCMRSDVSQYVVAPIVGAAVRIGNGNLINNLSGLTIQYDTTHTNHALAYTLSNAGTYLVNASISFYYDYSTNVYQSYTIYDNTNNVKLSNTSEHTQSNIDYPYSALLSTIVEISSTPTKISVRCLNTNTSRIATANIPYINGAFARTSHITIWKLR